VTDEQRVQLGPHRLPRRRAAALVEHHPGGRQFPANAVGQRLCQTREKGDDSLMA
jgi:hypothetical protein